MSFTSALRSGKIGEELIQTLLQEASIDCCLNPKKQDIEWDIEASLFGLKFHIEAKSDLMEHKTGNVAIEYWNPRMGKASGIFATRADLWAIILSNPVTVWVAHVSDLKKYVEQEKPLKDIQAGGDENASLKVYNRDIIFDDVFHRIDELPPWELSHLFTTLLGTKHERQRIKVMADSLQDIEQR